MFLGLSVLKLAGSTPWPFGLRNDRQASRLLYSFGGAPSIYIRECTVITVQPSSLISRKHY